jgi:hypothetical protein
MLFSSFLRSLHCVSIDDDFAITVIVTLSLSLSCVKRFVENFQKILETAKAVLFAGREYSRPEGDTLALS